ncbi:MAG: hypothetical protein KDC54_16715 [Lewinella sp.]|nr:hypothetical protein [Lewinella sp.]
MSPFQATLEQSFSQESLAAISSLLGCTNLQFAFDQVYCNLNSFPNRQLDHALVRGRNLRRLLCFHQNEVTHVSVNLPPFAYPFVGSAPHLSMSILSPEQVARNPMDWNQASMVAISGRLTRISGYYRYSSVEEYDIQSLVGHAFEPYFPDAPTKFSHLITTLNYFSYLVLDFDQGKQIILERPESSDLVLFHDDRAAEIMELIQTSYDDETGQNSYQLRFSLENPY